MALQWIDGFDQYENGAGFSGDLIRGDYTNIDGSPTIASGLLGNGVYCNTYYSFRYGGQFSRAILGDRSKIGIGLHFRATDTTTRSGPLWIELSNGVVVGFTAEHNNASYVCYKGGPTYTANPANIGALEWVPIAGEWYHLEAVLDLTAGTFSLRVNGQPVGVIDISGQGWSALTIAAARFSWVHTRTTAYTRHYFDNLYIWDTAGTEANDWLGERNVYTLFPDGDETPQDWSLSSGTDAYDLVNNTDLDDTRYIESAAVDDVSKFSVQDLPSSDVEIVGVQITGRGFKTGTPNTSTAVGLHDNYSDAFPLVQDQAANFHAVWAVNPDDGEVFEPADLNNMVISVKRVE